MMIDLADCPTQKRLCLLPGLPENSDLTTSNPFFQMCCPKGREIFCDRTSSPHPDYCLGKIEFSHLRRELSFMKKL